MFKLNKVDQEIIRILKDVFAIKHLNPLLSDDNMRLWIIRSLFLTSVLGLLIRVILGLSGNEITTEFSGIINLPIVIFFGVLFLHLNNELENTSLIVFVLTWTSMVIGFYV